MDTHDECSSYTSLRDVLPASSPRMDSWREISIKDPLVQHAAWAYLQPMMTACVDVERGSFFQRIKNKCCGLFECFNDVVLISVKSLFSSEEGSQEEDEYKLE